MYSSGTLRSSLVLAVFYLQDLCKFKSSATDSEPCLFSQNVQYQLTFKIHLDWYSFLTGVIRYLEIIFFIQTPEYIRDICFDMLLLLKLLFCHLKRYQTVILLKIDLLYQIYFISFERKIFWKSEAKDISFRGKSAAAFSLWKKAPCCQRLTLACSSFTLSNSVLSLNARDFETTFCSQICFNKI